MSDFVSRLVTWQLKAGRHDLPWQQTRDPYRVWLSEIMLQQTQVNTVITYYQRFLERFPDVQALGQAEQAEVMPYWAGLGYYARARNLHRCAQIICQEFAGQFPQDPEVLQSLPGIGKSTANAIAAFCFDASTPIMDGNVKRVFTRFYGIYGTGSATEKQLWQQAYQNAQGQGPLGRYNQALMDLGSSICKRSKPLCQACPLQSDCYAHTHQCQAELPTRKVKKAIPTRHCQMLILQKGSQVFLQKRPATGIWGGLLSLPEFADEQALHQALIKQELIKQDFMNQDLTARSTHAAMLRDSASPEDQHLTQSNLDNQERQHHLTQALNQYDVQAMAAFEHVFSHYRLIIQPQWLTINPQYLPEQNFNLEGAWYELAEIETLALPAPVLKILQGIQYSL